MRIDEDKVNGWVVCGKCNYRYVIRGHESPVKTCVNCGNEWLNREEERLLQDPFFNKEYGG